MSGFRWRLLAVMALVLSVLALTGPTWAEPAPVPDSPLEQPAEEARARALFREIRCVVCQHESIADSPAGLASDLRAWVRARIAEGRTDAEIRAGLVERYGDYVLFTPPVRPATLLLWGLPFLLLLGAGTMIVLALRRRPGEAAQGTLTDTEQARVDQLLKAASFRPEDASNPPHQVPGTGPGARSGVKSDPTAIDDW